MIEGKVNVLIDGQWGSTGKGKLAGLIALKHRIDLAVCNFMANAGHTWVPNNGGDPVMVQQLPTSLINPKTRLHIAATAVIDPDVLLKEIAQFNQRFNILPRLSIDPNAGIIKKSHKDRENATLHRISSTVKGCGAVLADKVMRQASLVHNESDGQRWYDIAVWPTSLVVHDALRAHDTILFETAQGFDLSVNHGWKYPFTTSRDITVSQALSDACCPPHVIGDVYASIRTFPIRVGNAFDVTKQVDGAEDGWSGPFYQDQEELTWEEVTKMSGSDRPLSERTTVTNKVRRIFTFSFLQLRRFVLANRPSFIFLNFVNYLDAKAYGLSAGPDRESIYQFYSLFPSIRKFVKQVEEAGGVPVAYLGTGPEHGHVIDLGIDR
jgi:adenylosuccinate synthase